MAWTAPTPPTDAPTTKAQWQAMALWHLQMASWTLLPVQPPDAVAMGARASAHARTGQAILQAIDTKLIT